LDGKKLWHGETIGTPNILKGPYREVAVFVQICFLGATKRGEPESNGAIRGVNTAGWAQRRPNIGGLRGGAGRPCKGRAQGVECVNKE